MIIVSGKFDKFLHKSLVMTAYKFYHIILKWVTHIDFQREIARALIEVERTTWCSNPPRKAVDYDEISDSFEFVLQEDHLQK